MCATLPNSSFRGDEIRLAGGVLNSGRRALVGAGAGAAPAGACGPRIRSGPSRLTLRTVVAAGPTGGASAVPTEMRRASGLPVVSLGAVAVAGTSKLCPASSTPALSVVAPSLTWIQTGSLAVITTTPCGAGER